MSFPFLLSAAEPQPITLNEWTEISTPDKPFDKKNAPAILKQYVGGYKYANAYRIKLAPGETYTFQTEYPADRKFAKATIYGLNPYSKGSSFSNPSGTTYIAISRERSFPGGNIKGFHFGRLANFTVSEKSEHSYAFLIMAGHDPGISMRCNIIHPAVPDEKIAKEGRYEIKPGGSKTFGPGRIQKKPFWLGYASNIPKLPFPWELDAAQTGMDVSGVWNTQSGDLSLVQDGQKLDGRYPTDNGLITGIMKGNVFSGYWIEDKADERCAKSLEGRYYWGKMKLVFDGDRFSGSWDYCGKSVLTSGWDGNRKDGPPVAVAASAASPQKTVAKADESSWRDLPDFEFKLIED